MNAKLDNQDRLLLALLQEDNLRTHEELSRLVNLSASACRRRVENLREGGVILADVSIIDPVAVGRPLLVVALVSLERDAPEAHRTFRDLLLHRPEVVQAFFTAGRSDYVLLISVATVEEYESLSSRMFTANAHVQHFETMIVMSRVKWGTTIPVEAKAAMLAE